MFVVSDGSCFLTEMLRALTSSGDPGGEYEALSHYHHHHHHSVIIIISIINALSSASSSLTTLSPEVQSSSSSFASVLFLIATIMANHLRRGIIVLYIFVKVIFEKIIHVAVLTSGGAPIIITIALSSPSASSSSLHCVKHHQHKNDHAGTHLRRGPWGSVRLHSSLTPLPRQPSSTVPSQSEKRKRCTFDLLTWIRIGHSLTLYHQPSKQRSSNLS